MQTILNFYVFLLVMGPLLAYSQAGEPVNKTDDNGKKHGLWIKKDRRDDLVYKGYFEHGQPVDTFTYFYSKDKVKALVIHREGSKSAFTTLYFKNGNKKAEGKYLNQKRDSIWRFYDKSGDMVSMKGYEKGKEDGLSRYYYDSGQLLKKTIYENGRPQGREVIFYRDSTKEKVQHYHNGKLHGDFTVFYPTGDTMTDGAYSSDYRTGKWRYFNNKGVLTEVRVYKKGELISKEFLKDTTKSGNRPE